MGASFKRWAMAVLLTALTACAASSDHPPAQAADNVSALPVPQHWSVFLIAGDNAAPVFDNAILRFKTLLNGPAFAPIDSFSADEMPGTDIATGDRLAAALADLPSGNDTGCLVFITSHGGRDGVVLKADFEHQQRLTPTRLGNLLDNSCGARPTVAIISACFSGIFLDLAAPNRIILTAARSDRTSFGCGAEFEFTYYDACLLDAWPHAANFFQLHDAVLDCVRQKERAIGITPSEPQASFGTQVGRLPVPR